MPCVNVCPRTVLEDIPLIVNTQHTNRMFLRNAQRKGIPEKQIFFGWWPRPGKSDKYSLGGRGVSDCLHCVCADIIYFLKRTIELSCTFMPRSYCPHEAQDKGSSHPSLVPQGRHTHLLFWIGVRTRLCGALSDLSSRCHYFVRRRTKMT